MTKPDSQRLFGSDGDDDGKQVDDGDDGDLYDRADGTYKSKVTIGPDGEDD